MQRHFKRGSAPQSTETIITSLSVEEEAIQADVHSLAEIDMDNAVGDVERITEVAEVSTDATLIVNEIPEVGTVEESLLASVADMAVAGTDAASDDMLSVARTEEGVVSVEGVVAVLKSIWDSIVSGLKNMWLGIKHWFTSYFSTLDKNKKQAEELIKKLDGMHGWIARTGSKITIQDMFSYGRASAAAAGGAAKIIHEVDAEDKAVQQMVRTAIEAQVSTMLTVGDSIIKGFHAYHGGADLGELGQVADVTARNMQSYIRKLGITTEDKKTNELKSATHGSMTLVATGFSKVINNPANTPETKIALLNKVRFKVEQRTDMIAGSDTEVAIMEDLTADMLKVVVKSRLDFINWQLQHRDTDIKKLEEKSAAVQKACEEMLTRIKPEDQPGTARGRQMMPLATAYANWATQPAVKLMSTVARHNNYWLTAYAKLANVFTDENS